MQIRIRLGIKFALTIGTVLALFIATYHYLRGEIGRIRQGFEEIAEVRDPTLRAAFELKIAVADSALIVRDQSGRNLRDWRQLQLVSESRFESALTEYLRLSSTPGTQSVAEELRALYRRHAGMVREIMRDVEQRQSAAPELIEDAVAFRSGVADLAKSLSAAPPRPGPGLAEELTGAGARTASLLTDFTRAPGAQEAWQIEEGLKRFDRLLTACLDTGPPVATVASVELARAPIEDLRAALQQTLAAQREIDTALPRLRVLQQKMTALLDKRVLARAHAALLESNDVAAQGIARAERHVALLLVLAVALGLVASLLLTRSVLRPVQTLLAATRAVAAGDLGRRVVVVNRDELGDLAASFNRMAAELEQTTVSRSVVDSILQSMGEALFVLTPEFVIERANPKAGQLLKTTPAALIGQPLGRFLDRPLAPAAEMPGHADQENVLRVPGGGAIPVLIALSSMADAGDARDHLVCTTMDITARQTAEQALAASRDQLRELYQTLQQVQEEERAHLAREIHDELGAVLTVMKTTLFLLGKQSPGAVPDMSQLLAQLHELVDQASSATDRIVNGLRPPILDHFGLGAALEWYAADFERRTGLTCSLELPAQDPEIDDEQALTLFRVAQECLTNTARHARASHVDIGLREHGSGTTLTLCDDGIGCTPDVLRESGRAGLRGLRERITRLHGTLTVVPEPAGGLRVEARLPRPALAA